MDNNTRDNSTRTDNVRVRFAPSPTGFPHIGNIRTALFNCLFARHHGGKFLVRVEDTDQNRMVPGATDAVLEALDWLDIQWDEGPRVGGPYGPYFQSQRLDIYQRLAGQLLDRELAYRCYCSEEQLKEVREAQARAKHSLGYDGRCRYLSQDERRAQEVEGGSSVIRFAMPTSGITVCEDLIRGQVIWQNELLDDFILIKSDGFPTYHMAVVTDDQLMEISHVMRAEEWLPSTPKHLQLQQALGYEPPKFAHLPMILGPDRAKLSKRHGATTVLDYRDQGFMQEALVNFLELVGWSLDDHTEIMTPSTVIENFSLERVSKAAAIFDYEKLTWMNGIYIRQLSEEDLADRLMPFLERDLPSELLPVDRDYLLRIVPLIQERTKLLCDAANMTEFFFQTELDFEPEKLIQKGMDQQAALSALAACQSEISSAQAFEHEPLEKALRAAATELGLSPRQFFGTLRVAATGKDATPPLFETMEVLGRERVLERIQRAIQRLGDAD